MNPDFFTTERRNAELLSKLIIGDRYRVLMSVAVPVEIGDLIQVVAEFQCTTNEVSKSVMIASQLILGTSTEDITATTGGEITEANAYNLIPAVHHGMTHRGGAIISKVRSARTWVNLLVRADSTSAKKDIVVDKDYGHLDVIVHRGVG